MTDWNPVHRVFGERAFGRLPEILSSSSAKTLLVVLGERSFRHSSYFKSLELWLAPYRVLFTSPIPQNPTQEFIQSEIGRFKAEAFDLVLAVGGGSVLDVAKLMAAVIPQKNQSLSDYINQSATFRDPSVPLIAVPTTAGTGSEVTPFASLETHEKKKISISDTALFPSVAVVDPLLTYSMPGYLTASSGFDAIAQAIESFWSVHATPSSRPHALKSLGSSIENLPRVMEEPHSSSGRSAMALASSEAGLAIAQTKTTAVHSVSYPMTAHFRIAHGHACALTLSSFIRFNAPVLKEEGRPLLNAFKASSYEDMADQVDRLMERVGLQRKLSSLGIQREGLELIIRDGFRPDRIKNNPREVTQEAVRDILNQIY